MVWDSVVVEVSKSSSVSAQVAANVMRIASNNTSVVVSPVVPALKLVWDAVVVEVGESAIDATNVVWVANSDGAAADDGVGKSESNDSEDEKIFHL